MVRFRSLIILVFLVFGLASPSLASALDGLVVEGVMVVTAGADTIATQALTPCELQGGKRVLPCHPDLGVLVAPVAAAVGAGLPAARPGNDLVPAGTHPEALAPPPRPI